MSGWQYDGYSQDNWRLTGRVSLSLGLRYEYANEFTEENDLAQAFDINTLELTASGAQIDEPDANNFGPRLGVIYDLFGDSRTVLGVAPASTTRPTH